MLPPLSEAALQSPVDADKVSAQSDIQKQASTSHALYRQSSNNSGRLRFFPSSENTSASSSLPKFPAAQEKDRVDSGESRALYSDTQFEIQGPNFESTLVFLSESVSLTDAEKGKAGNAPLVLELQNNSEAARFFSACAQNMGNAENLVLAAHPDSSHKVNVLHTSDQELSAHTGFVPLYELFKENDQLRIINIDPASGPVNVIRRDDERVRLWRGFESAETRDGYIKRHFQTSLINGQFDGNWNRALSATPYGALNPVMQLKLLEHSELSGNARKVTIGRNVANQRDIDGKVFGDICNDMDLLGFGNAVSRHHGNLFVTEDGKYWYMDEYSLAGTRIAMDLEQDRPRTVFANLGIGIGRGQFLTFVDTPKDTVVEDNATAKRNKDFSARILSLKKDEVLTVRIDRLNNIHFNQPVYNTRSSRRNSDYCSFSVKAKGNDRYEFNNLQPETLHAIQLLNPTLSRPAKMEVQEEDQIVFNNINNNVIVDGYRVAVNDGNDFCFVVPPPLDTLRLNKSEIEEEVAQANGIDRNADDTFTVTYAQQEQRILDTVIRTRRDPEFERLQRQRQLAVAAKEGNLPGVQQFFNDGDLDIDACDNDYSSALSLATQNLHVETVKWLLNNGADSKKKGGYYQEAPLAALARGQRTSYSDNNAQKKRDLYRITRLLIEHGADVEAQDRFGDTVRVITEESRARPNPVIRAINGEEFGGLNVNNATS